MKKRCECGKQCAYCLPHAGDLCDSYEDYESFTAWKDWCKCKALQRCIGDKNDVIHETLEKCVEHLEPLF